MGLNIRQENTTTAPVPVHRAALALPPPVFRYLGSLLLAICLLALTIALSPAVRALAAMRTAQIALYAAQTNPSNQALVAEALAAIRQAQALAPDDVGLQRAQAQAHTLAGASADAVAALERAAALRPGSPLITQELALAYEVAGLPEQAVAAWRELGQSGVSLAQVGERYRRAGQLEVALVWYRRAATLDPQLADPWYYSGLVAEAHKSWVEAHSGYDAALERSAFVAVGRSDVLTQKALAYYREDRAQVPLARPLYEQALALDDFKSNLLEAAAAYEIAQIDEALGAPAAAVAESYRAVLAVRPYHQWARMRLGRLLFTALDDPQGAEAELRWVIEQIPETPDHKWAYHWLGDLYRASGRDSAASAAYREAARLDPSDTAVQEALEALNPSTR